MEQGGSPCAVGEASMVSSNRPHGGVFGLVAFSAHDHDHAAGAARDACALALRRRAASDDEDKDCLATVAVEDVDGDDVGNNYDDNNDDDNDDDDEEEEEEEPEGSRALSRRRPFEPSARSSRAFPREDEDSAGAAPYEDDDEDEDDDGDIDDEGEEEDEYVDDRPNAAGANAEADVTPTPPVFGHRYPPGPNNEESGGDNPECPKNGSAPSQDPGMARARVDSTQTKKNPSDLDGSGQGAPPPGADEEKKDAEPFAVPTAGAFYMHDDRFQGAAGARHRRSAGGRKLWEAKDEKPWVHDRFEELNLNEERFSRKGSRGRGGRGLLKGRGRGRSSGFLKGRSKAIDFPDRNILLPYAGSRRGRGIRRRPLRSGNHEDGHLSVKVNSNSTGTSSEAPAVSQKPIINSRLNSESPPFFPSGALQQNTSGPNTGVTAIPGFGLTSVDARGLDGNMPTTSANSALQQQQQQSTKDEQMFPQITRLIQNQAMDYSEPQGSMQGQDMQQQIAQTGGNLPSISAVSNESSNNSSLHEKGALVGRDAHARPLQIGRGSLMNSGAQSGGLAGVVQFNGQPPLGIGVPAMGMALPGYSGQPQFGFSNSEVTWVPILAGGSSMGTSYSSPYIATMDGNSSGLFYTQPTTQSTSYALPGQNLNALETSSAFWKPPARPDLANDEFAHRQNKPRRYSEMNFGQ